MAKTAVEQWDTTAANNTEINSIPLDGAVTTPSQVDDIIREMMAQVAAQVGEMNFEGADIASATTTNLANATGWSLDITGTTTITGFGTVAAGKMFMLRFVGALTLTHNATSLILPGAANITTAANDVAFMKSEGSGNWRCMNYQRAAGVATVGPSSSTDNTVPRFNGTAGALQTSGVLVDDSDTLTMGGGTDISPSNTPTGQAIFKGSAYSGYVALDATGMHIGHNSSARNFTIDINETPIATFSTAGALTLTGGLAATTGTFSGAVSMTGLTATTGAFSGAVTVSGAFTSLGIDDNATGERFQLADAIGTWGTSSGDFSMVKANADGVLYVSGGSANTTGANMFLAGGSHATIANDWGIRSGASTVLGWDDSASTLVLSGSMTTSGSIVASGHIQSLERFIGTADAVLATNGANTIFLRPNGAGFASGQMSVASTGNVTVNGNMTSVADGFHTNNKTAANAATVGASVISSGQGLFTVAADTCQILNRTGVDGTIVQIRNDNTTVGTIEVAGAATNYNTSSDERLKENFRSFDAGVILDAISVYHFDWKDSGRGRIDGYGVKAQEAYEVFPHAIKVGDEEEPWGADYSKFVPLLIAEVKALRARVEALEA